MRINTEASDIFFLKVMLEEFALQLDTEPVFDRLVPTPEVTTMAVVVFVGGGHGLQISGGCQINMP